MNEWVNEYLVKWLYRNEGFVYIYRFVNFLIGIFIIFIDIKILYK